MPYARHAGWLPEAEGKPMVAVSDNARRTPIVAGAPGGLQHFRVGEHLLLSDYLVANLRCGLQLV